MEFLASGPTLYNEDFHVQNLRLPRLTRYHTAVTDALLWRFVGLGDKTRYSQHPHLLRNYMRTW